MKTLTTNPEFSSGAVSPAAVEESRSRALLIDVRSPAEFEEAHIPGSVLSPGGDLDSDAIRSLAAGKSACIIVCQSGNRARRAAEKLSDPELPPMAILGGGIRAWEAAGLPLTRGRKTISLERQVRIAAGSFVVIGALLGFFVNPAWIALSAFVGTGLIFAGITDTCGMGLLLARMPWNQRGRCAHSASCSLGK